MINKLLTEDTKAIILLCGVFGNDRFNKPLSLKEYSSLVRWLIRANMRPADLLQKPNIAEASLGCGIDRQRMESLLSRGVELGFAVEEWQRSGIWIISRSDTDYPSRYKKHLKDKAPPLLFGVGDRSLLNGGGLGIVGSRNVDRDGEAFTRYVAELCVDNQMPVVSGGARGVDQISMTAAIDAGGVSIGILAENLLKKSLERKNRYAIADGRLLLLSPYHPNSRFTVGAAMGRNKLIYAMADYGLVVSAKAEEGGTWAGAIEELKRENPRPIYVRVGDKVPQGNNKLLDLGAIRWPESVNKENLKRQLAEITANNQRQKPIEQPTLFDSVKNTETSADGEIDVSSEKIPNTIYEAVLPIILKELNSEKSQDELVTRLNVQKNQLNMWLKQAVEDGVVEKYSRPVRYIAIKSKMAQQGV